MSNIDLYVLNYRMEFVMKKIFMFICVLLCSLSFTQIFAEKDCKKHGKDCDGAQCERHHHAKKGMFVFLDKDKDGKITSAEWSAHFDEMDANKDGVLTKDELKAHHNKNKK